MRVIVTRPQAQAEPLVASLRAAGIDAVALPLIHIVALDDAQPLHAAWAGLADYALVMFVSANAVQHFMQVRPPGRDWPAQVLAGAPGPGTSAALRAAGVPPAALVEPAPGDAFESEALWRQLRDRDWQGRRALIVRGQGGRDWLGAQLGSRGARVDFVTAYRRLPPQPDAAAGALLHDALTQPREHLWLLSSSEAAANLQRLAPQADWHAATAAAPHARIVATLQRIGFGQVHFAPVETAALVALVDQLLAAQRSA